MKRVIVTGASGFVGANLARRLLSEGHEVHLLLRPQYAPWRLAEIRDAVRLHLVDFQDPVALGGRVREIRPEWIFHLAAYGAYASQADPVRMVETNITGTMNLVNACIAVGFEAFVNTGSSSEYGFKDHAPPESECPEPNSPYAVTKLAATQFCRYAARSADVHIPTLRLYSVYGPYEEPTRLIPQIIANGLKGSLPPLVSPETARDYVHVDDVCGAYLAAAENHGVERGAIFNVGSGVQTTIRQVVELARRKMDLSAEPVWNSMPGRLWDSKVWVADSQKIGRELGWKAGLSFDEGFSRTVEWFRANPGQRGPA